MIIEGILLGIIQGLTEFLPVSSSGHLVIFKKFLQVSTTGAFFEAILHMGTLLAVLAYFYKKILKIKLDYVKAIFFATLPAAFFGIIFKSPIELLFTSTKVVALALLVTAAINFYTDKYNGRKKNVDLIDSFLIGTGQAISLVPGISRSGITMLFAKKLQIDGESAAEFSFIMSVPAILGAVLIQYLSHGFTVESSQSMLYMAGFLSSFLMGLLAIKITMRMIQARRFKFFAAYCLMLAVLTFIFG